MSEQAPEPTVGDEHEQIRYLADRLKEARQHIDNLLFHLSKETINAAREFQGHPPLK